MINKIFNFQFRIFHSSRGFTVLESVVAIMILSLAIAGVFSAIQRSLSQAITAKDEVKAFYLAEEAVEIIRNKRDANQLSRIKTPPGNNWLWGIAESAADPCYFGNICRVDATNLALTYCGTSFDTCPVLNQNSTTFLYAYTSGAGWSATRFKREIQIEQISANEVSVTVRVSWTNGIFPREFKVKTILFNWI